MPLDPESVALADEPKPLATVLGAVPPILLRRLGGTAEIARVDLDAVPFDPVLVDELPDGRLRFRLAEEILP